VSKRGSCNGCDIPKRLPTLTGFGHHPDSSQRAFEEVRHTLYVCIGAKFSLGFCPTKHPHQAISMYSRRMTRYTRYIGIPLTELAD
jgi:hypothetical protein